MLSEGKSSAKINIRVFSLRGIPIEITSTYRNFSVFIASDLGGKPEKRKETGKIKFRHGEVCIATLVI